MIRTTKRFVLNAALIGTLAATPSLALAYHGANGFVGTYAGGQIGINDSSAPGLNSADAFTGGVRLGYNFAEPVGNQRTPFVLGGDLFEKFNTQGSHQHHIDYGSNVFGGDFLAGYPIGATHDLMPFVKVGVGHLNATGDLDGSGTGVRAGLGAELRLHNALGLTAQWMHQDTHHITNNNFTVGVNYHFGR